MPQQVCTTICSLQSSLDIRLFVLAVTQPLGTVVMKVVEPLLAVTGFLVGLHETRWRLSPSMHYL